MIAHDEGMMDEGAASLRDRDMIACRRGGPFVHRTASCPSFLFLLLERVSRLLPVFVLPVAYVARTPTVERTPVTGLSDLAGVCPANAATRKLTLPKSRLFMRREI